MEVTWGQVTSASPVLVRLVGDDVDVPVGLKFDGLTVTDGDKVALVKLGSTGGWCIAAKVVST